MCGLLLLKWTSFPRQCEFFCGYQRPPHVGRQCYLIFFFFIFLGPERERCLPKPALRGNAVEMQVDEYTRPVAAVEESRNVEWIHHTHLLATCVVTCCVLYGKDAMVKLRTARCCEHTCLEQHERACPVLMARDTGCWPEPVVRLIDC